MWVQQKPPLRWPDCHRHIFPLDGFHNRFRVRKLLRTSKPANSTAFRWKRVPFVGGGKTNVFFGGWKNLTDPFLLKPKPKTPQKLLFFLLVMHRKSSCCTTTTTRLSCPPHCITRWRRVVGFKPQIWASLPKPPAMPPNVPTKLGLCSGIINHHDPLMIP